MNTKIQLYYLHWRSPTAKFQSFEITKQAQADSKKKLPIFQCLHLHHSFASMKIGPFISFISFPLSITFSPLLIDSGTANGHFIRAHTDKSKLESTWESLGRTCARRDSFDLTLHLTGGHEQEKEVSITLMQKMKRTQTYTTLHQWGHTEV